MRCRLVSILWRDIRVVASGLNVGPVEDFEEAGPGEWLSGMHNRIAGLDAQSMFLLSVGEYEWLSSCLIGNGLEERIEHRLRNQNPFICTVETGLQWIV